MPRFFINDNSITDEFIKIMGEDAHHISHSLRMRIGEKLVICDGVNEYNCEIVEFTSDCVKAKIIDTNKITTEPSYELVLLQALPKSDKMDEIVKQTVECGVSRIIPFISSRCINHPDEKTIQKKTERWNKIAKEAAMQSGRGIIPKVNNVISFKDAINLYDSDALKLFFYEGESAIPLPKVLSTSEIKGRVIAVIGSEGGFSPEEALFAKSSGFELCGLGKRILRCENAPVVALSCISYQFEM